MGELKLTKLNKKKRSLFKIGDISVGRDLLLIAGPCSIENLADSIAIAKAVKQAGANFFRGGIYKPRTSPYDFQGLGREGLDILGQVKIKTGMAVITEIMDPRDLKFIQGQLDVIQIGSKNMFNYPLLKEAGRIHIPVILKRGSNATITEWLHSAEYIMHEGNKQVILCERGIRTFETYTRNTLDLSCIPALKEITHLPIIVDPSHGTGKAGMVEPMSLAAISAGADGLMIEVHTKPEQALSDRDQQVTPQLFFKFGCQDKKTVLLYQRRNIKRSTAYSLMPGQY